KIVRENAREIRHQVLRYLMVRRTRTEVMNYFAKDLEKQNLRFPEVNDPTPLFYELNEIEDQIFNETVELISQDFKYSRYTPMLYYSDHVAQREQIAQINMGKFMKILLVKRLESSFFAFKKSVERFICSYDMFINEYQKGNVYISKDYSNKIFDLLEKDDDDAIQRLLDEGKAERYASDDFSEQFLADLQSDRETLLHIRSMWKRIQHDPKLESFIKVLSTNSILKNSKPIIFTESKETAEYLTVNINKQFNNQAICFSGGSGEAMRDIVINNFDAKVKHPRDDYRILISTEVLSEGVNLHRSNVVINYDIPWNPTRMMQRVGRINRVDTAFDSIYTFNFFPTKQSNDQIKLKEAAQAKISGFLTLLGGDAALLTDGEPVGSHELFDRLLSKQTLTGEDESEESELKYLQIIKNIRDNDPELFEHIKRLPKKARTAKLDKERCEALISYFRQGKLQKFFMAQNTGNSNELDFLSAAGIIESDVNGKRQKLSERFYDLLNKNKEAFVAATTEELAAPKVKRGSDSGVKILKIIKVTFKNTKQFTEDQETYLKEVAKGLEEGGFPKQTTKATLKALNELAMEIANPFKVLGTLQQNIPSKLLAGHYAEKNLDLSSKREVILSMYLTGE
ncbi:MAG: C-terminal helicase domain-containing protein, partial [Desulfomonilaceae bacterium]